VKACELSHTKQHRSETTPVLSPRQQDLEYLFWKSGTERKSSSSSPTLRSAFDVGRSSIRRPGSRMRKIAGLLCEPKEAGLGSERQRNGDRARVGAGRIGHGRPGRHSKTGCLFEAKTEFPIRPRQCQKIGGSGADECGTFRPDLNYPGIISAEAGEGFVAVRVRGSPMGPRSAMVRIEKECRAALASQHEPA